MTIPLALLCSLLYSLDMTNTKETVPGTRVVGQRLAQGEVDFISMLELRFRLARVEAEKVLAVFRKHKVVKRSAATGVISVVHGGFLEPDVIERALAEDI